MNQIRVAIDGPAGAGKSTVAKLVAKSLKLPYIDTGAMYRAVTWKALQSKIDLAESDNVTELASNVHITFEMQGDSQIVYLDDINVTEQIRSKEVTENVSKVAAIPGVRIEMVKLQQKIAKHQGVVMDGRDIGTYVIPDAEVKVFLTASLEERATRRMQELETKGDAVNLQDMEKSLAKRDELDSTRDFAPLKQAEDAYLLDSTGMTIAEVVEKILLICKTHIGTNK